MYRMNMHKLMVLFLALLTAMPSCAPPHPVLIQTPPPAIPTTATPTLVPVTPTAISSPTPQPSTQRDSETQDQLPILLAEENLGVRFEYLQQHTLALDVAHGRIFIGAPPTQTLILSTETLRITETLPVGGGVAIDPKRERLFIGTPVGVAVFNLDSLQLAGTIPITASFFGSTPIVDSSTGDLFIVHNGIYVADPTSFQVTARISGTFPTAGGTVPNPYAVDAALNAQNRQLYVSLNNGIPGSNNGNTLTIYDLKSGAAIYQDGERSIVSFDVDEDSGRLFVTRSRMNTSSLSIIEGGTKPVLRINGITGSVKADMQRGRIYISESWGPSPRLLVLDSATGALIADVPLPRLYMLAAFDADADRLYFLSPDGYLMVMSGHGTQPPVPQTFEPIGVLTGSVAWIAPSPNFADDRVLFAAWTPTGYSGGPLGSQAGQLLASTDAGMTWGRVRGGLPAHLVVNALAYSPDFARDKTVFAALLAPNGGGGLYISNDAGQSWRPATRGLNDWVIAEIAVAPGFPINRTVFALTWQGGLFRSTDGGKSWQRTSYTARPVAMNARTLAISPDFIQDKTLVVSSGDSTSISRDGGENWWPLLENRAASLVLASGDIMMGSFSDAGVLRSRDGGVAWQAASHGLRLDISSRVMLALSPDFARDGTAFALVQSYERSALYRTIDGGASWQIESSEWTGRVQITALAVSPNWTQDETIFIGLNDGRLRGVKVGDLKWSDAPAALDRLNIEAIAISPDYARDSTIFIGSGQAGMFVSTNGGQSWQETSFPARSTGANRIYIAFSPNYANDHMIFASASGQVFRSEDNGATWQVLTSGLGNFFQTSALAISPQFASDRTVLIGGGYRTPRVMRSSDAGQTWSATSGLQSNNGIQALAFAPGIGNVAYAWADQAGLYRSGDGGATWTRVFSPTGAAGWGVQSLAISPNFPQDRLMFLGAVGAENIRRSANGGATWHPSVTGLPAGLTWGSAIALSPNFKHDQTIFLGTDKGVFCSQDGGVTWKASSRGLPQAGVLALAISPDFTADPPGGKLFVGLVDRGLYVSNDGGTTWKAAR